MFAAAHAGPADHVARIGREMDVSEAEKSGGTDDSDGLLRADSRAPAPAAAVPPRLNRFLLLPLTFPVPPFELALGCKVDLGRNTRAPAPVGGGCVRGGGGVCAIARTRPFAARRVGAARCAAAARRRRRVLSPPPPCVHARALFRPAGRSRRPLPS